MAETMLLICDKCASQNGTVQRITLITEDGRASFDLCNRCRKPLNEILGLLAKSPIRRNGRPSGLVKSMTAKVYADPSEIPGKRKHGRAAGKPMKLRGK